MIWELKVLIPDFQFFACAVKACERLSGDKSLIYGSSSNLRLGPKIPSRNYTGKGRGLAGTGSRNYLVGSYPYNVRYTKQLSGVAVHIQHTTNRPTNIVTQRHRPHNLPMPSDGARQPSPAAFASLSSRPSTGSLRTAPPPSPRSPSRHLSISQHSMADLLSTPPLPKQEGAIPRDWRSVSAGELVDQQVLRFVELDTPVESACQVRPASFFK
jgi:hypothetical protein